MMFQKPDCLLVILTAALMAACSACREPAPHSEEQKLEVTYQSSVEPEVWINQHTLSGDNARSWPWSSKLDSLNEFSYGFRSELRQISDTLPVYLEVSFWLFPTKPATDAELVVSVDSLTLNRFWTSISLRDSLDRTGEWNEIRSRIRLPRNLRATDKISVYVWNGKKNNFWVDDLTLNFRLR